MTTTNDKSKQQEVRRMVELGTIVRQRHLDAVGNRHLSVGSLNNNDTLTTQERQEFLDLANQVFDDESIANYLKKKWHLARAVCSDERKYEHIAILFELQTPSFRNPVSHLFTGFLCVHESSKDCYSRVVVQKC